MKICTTCQKQFSDDTFTCPQDGSILMDAAAPSEKPASLLGHDDDWMQNKLKAGAEAAAFQANELHPPPVKMAPPPPPPELMSAQDSHIPSSAQPPAPVAKKDASTGLPSARSKEELERLLTPQRPKVTVAAPPPAAPKPPEAAPAPVRRAAPPPPSSTIPWNKIAPIAIVAVIVIGGLLLFKPGGASKPTATGSDASAGNSNAPAMEDIDVELGVRQAFAKTTLLRNENVDIRVKDGTVTFIGDATSAAKIEQAMREARSMPGVRNVVSKVTIRGRAAAETDTHVFKTGSLQQSDQSTGPGVAQQSKAHDLVLSGQKQMAKGDYKGAASLFRQALALNPDDSEAQAGYAAATDKMQ